MTLANIDALPFLPGVSAIVDRVAHRHDENLSDPVILAMRPAQTGPSWAELLRAGQAALESVGREIAEAKTSDQAAAATLRQNSYLAPARSMDDQMLRVAVQLLALGPMPDFEAGAYIGFVGCGRRAVGGPLEPIPFDHWEVGTMDWLRRVLTLQPGQEWLGVRILDLADISGVDAGTIVESLLTPANKPEIRDAVKLKPVSEAELHRVLEAYVRDLPKGHKPTERELVEVASKSTGKDLSRDEVRAWIRGKMDQSKRRQRGEKRKPGDLTE
jgi:hypothetical protein